MDILIIIITFPYSTCISSFLAASSLFLCSFLNVFSFFKNKNTNKKPKLRFFTSRGAHVNCADVIHSFYRISVVEHDGSV